MLKCAILGAKGFTGQELVRILSKHPEVEISFLFTQDEQAIKLGEIAPELADLNLTIEHHEVDVMAKGSDVVFLALPHTISMNYAKEFLDQGCVVIDLSADFRFKDAATYEVYYKVSHTNQQLLEHSIYALPELFASEIKDCDLIANPGCYPTSVVLPIAPLLKEDLIKSDTINITSASGVSGAGKNADLEAAMNNYKAYKVDEHQHAPEIEHALELCASASKGELKIHFVPHLLPLFQGILTTLFVDLKEGVTEQAVREAYTKHYGDASFIRIKPEGEFPELKDVQKTNYCDIGFKVDEKDGRLIIISAIDNLIKGASGQAVQNMNVRFGFKEELGLV